MYLDPKTKSDAVYEALRRDIVSGRLKPGQKLVMSELAKEFRLSETPVREAIRRLESEGFLHFTPHLGAIVTSLDEEQLVEIYLIRIALETLATRLSAGHLKEDDLAFLEEKNREMATAIEEGRLEDLGELNRDFHLRIYRCLPYPRLYKMICDLWEAFERSQSVFSYVPERASASVREHNALIGALRARDAGRAEDLIRAQKERTLEALRRYSGHGKEITSRERSE